MPRTAAQLQTALNAYYAAQTALASAQSYTMDTGQGRLSLTRANLPDINCTIADLEAELAQAQDSGGGTMTIGVQL